MDDPESPEWLTEPCPKWCRRPHVPDDHAEDRRHQSAAKVIAVHTSRGPLPGDDDQVAELVVHADRRVGDPQVWIRIESVEDPHVRLALTHLSARTLMDALGATLTDVSE